MTQPDNSTACREQIHITVTDGPVRGSSCWSDAVGNMVVGRAQHCCLRVADPRMSREHFEATFSDDRWWLRDLASSNGTIVNGQRISGPVQAKSGDNIVAGDTRFQVIIADGELQRFAVPTPRGTEESSNRATVTGATAVD